MNILKDIALESNPYLKINQNKRTNEATIVSSSDFVLL